MTAVVNPDCQVLFAIRDAFPTAVIGAPFGFYNYDFTAGIPPNPGRFHITVNNSGAIQYVRTAAPLGPGIVNPATSFGGPWTTGMITLSVTANAGLTPEIFILTGYDNRVNGIGNISLVAGSISDRGLSGPNANRGWLNLKVRGQPNLPTVGAHGLVALMGLLALAGGYALRRRVLRSA
jgi:hypothetical protein